MAAPGAEQQGSPMLRAFRAAWLDCILRAPLVSLLLSVLFPWYPLSCRQKGHLSPRRPHQSIHLVHIPYSIAPSVCLAVCARMDWWQMAMEAVLLLRTVLVCTTRPPTGLGRLSKWAATTGMWGSQRERWISKLSPGTEVLVRNGLTSGIASDSIYSIGAQGV